MQHHLSSARVQRHRPPFRSTHGRTYRVGRSRRTRAAGVSVPDSLPPWDECIDAAAREWEPHSASGASGVCSTYVPMLEYADVLCRSLQMELPSSGVHFSIYTTGQTSSISGRPSRRMSADTRQSTNPSLDPLPRAWLYIEVPPVFRTRPSLRYWALPTCPVPLGSSALPSGTDCAFSLPPTLVVLRPSRSGTGFGILPVGLVPTGRPRVNPSIA